MKQQSASSACVPSAALLLVLLCSCNDKMVGPVDRPVVVRDADAGLVANVPLSPVDLVLTAEGSFQPGKPISVTAQARANADLRQIHLRLALPELEVLRRKGDMPWRAIVGETLPNEIEQTVAMTRGASVRLTTAVSFSKPGYYRVIVSGFVSADDASWDGQPLRDQVHEEMWLLIQPAGGGLRPTFDHNAVSQDFIPGIGAFRPKPVRPQGVLTSNVAEFSTSSIRRIVYLDPTIPGGTTYVPLANTEIYQWEVDEYDGREYGGAYLWTDANGYVELPCAPTNYYTIRYSIRFVDSDIRFDIANWEQNIDYYEDCGQQFDIGVWSAAGFVFTQMKTVIARSRQMLGYSRGSIWIHLRDVPGDKLSYYTKDYPYMGDDRITIDVAGPGAAVFGAYGAHVQAHEYGHALHWRSLGGYPSPWFSSLCDGHTLTPPSLEDWDCAYVEGFADYHAARVMRTEGGLYSNVVANNPHPDVTPAGRYEIHPASFLFDLADGPAGDEWFDDADYGDHYVATVIKTCAVSTGAWTRPDGIDGFITCFEQTANTTFPGRTYWAFAEQAAEPSSWCRAHVRRLWKGNMLNDTGPIACGSI